MVFGMVDKTTVTWPWAANRNRTKDALMAHIQTMTVAATSHRLRPRILRSLYSILFKSGSRHVAATPRDIDQYFIGLPPRRRVGGKSAHKRHVFSRHTHLVTFTELNVDWHRMDAFGDEGTYKVSIIDIKLNDLIDGPALYFDRSHRHSLFEYNIVFHDFLAVIQAKIKRKGGISSSTNGYGMITGFERYL
jgi:hypothetical protein